MKKVLCLLLSACMFTFVFTHFCVHTALFCSQGYAD